MLIYGVGKALENRINFFDVNDVLAFVDKDTEKTGKFFLGKPIISPNEINHYEFNRIVVSSVNYIEEIIAELVDIYNVDRSKIISLHHYIETYHLKRNYLDLDSRYFVEYLNSEKYCKLIDIGGFLQDVHYINNGKIIDTVCEKTLNKALVYNKVYENINQIQGNGYDVLVAIAPFTKHTVEEFISLISASKIAFKTMIITIPYIGSAEYEEWARWDFSSLGYVTCYHQFTSRLLIIENEQKMLKESSAMFTVTHKKFDIPINHDFYDIIHAGCENNEWLGYLGDNSGQNISSYNSMINECTALYWLWKNGKHDYFGICHYRRFFARQCDTEKIIMQEELAEILNECDIIVARRENFYPQSVKEQLLESMDKSAFETTIKATKSLILKKQPMYAEAFDYVMNGHEMFPCNMFFANKKIIGSYCEWLFSFILEVCDCVDLSKYDDYSKRAVGFMAERLLTVWLSMQSYRIQELEIKLVDSTPPTKKC